MESQIDHNFLRLGPNKESTLFLLNVIHILLHYFLQKKFQNLKRISIYVKSELILNMDFFIIQMPISALKAKEDPFLLCQSRPPPSNLCPQLASALSTPAETEHPRCSR